MMVGTPSYMAPEQADGSAASASMDVYAVGVMAFELLTNRLPFEGDSVVQVLMQHANAPVPAPSSLLPGIPAGLDALVIRLMQKKPAS